MDSDVSPLCCCEYFDNNNERNHILACCCSCVDLDEGVESLITGHGFPEQNRSRLMATLQDRLRIPWRGGAKQVSFDAILPVFILPLMFILSSISLWWTIFSFTAVVVILASVFRFFIKTIPQTKFFVVWTITSIIILYVIFELIVIPLLEILFEENVLLSVFFATFLLCFYLMKQRNNSLGRIGESEAESGFVGTGTRCYICQVLVPDKDHHCVWFDCCVGRHNQCLFILALIFAIASLVYSSNLTLTSVCHPFIFYKTILLPDDCSDVYQQFELGLSFVSALYSLGLATILLILLLHQILLVSVGLTSKEWRNLSFCAKCFLGLCSKRPHNLGFLRNWGRIMCWKRSYTIPR
ncbi:palmitoyltransferase ZDHHC23 [Tribolium castaneum]|uniref:Palmitoyltransferase n=1 Tax=Tribolium castaneum TaxID=7070 RepID=D6X334_TRICA|nr:PREDICTED: palmitoyltransferase ZDHHC23 [Tribolium castaneum]XP_015838980.1 PREDICTED: palmitoyltransferase ZDHHC23 [Tribolium castaneum]XP_969573.1 PREDICTED: palmitoyltransferase ZDHHC23 [Tribolium castaneum]EFA10318.2 Palmitoyltransferase ZDHHC23-like Protein [Tribolium castaneum]|eukprot:XP_008197982.1 PREDICTED: palmitoyltransferase ZDHHC23 [Tribolium castaneum]